MSSLPPESDTTSHPGNTSRAGKGSSGSHSSRKQAVASGKNLFIVGAGLSGLTAALYATAAGFHVTVLERESFVGGRCATEEVSVEKPGAPSTFPTDGGEEKRRPEILTAAFDTGATVWTMPSLLDDALAAVGLSVAEIDPTFTLETIEPSYHARFSNGTSFDVFRDEAKMEKSLLQYSGTSSVDLVARYRELRLWLQRLFDHSFTHFMSQSFDGPWNLIQGVDSIRDLVALVRLGAFGKLEPRVLGFLKDPQIARVFSFQALYAGVAPRKALAVYGCISHMDTTMGVYYPHSQRFGSGMGTIAHILAEALVRCGGEIRFGTDVQGLRVASAGKRSVLSRSVLSRGLHRCGGAQITGVELADGEVIEADGVIATVDLPIVQSWLSDAGVASAPRAIELRYSPSAVVMHGLVPTSVSQHWPTRHHTISFGEKWNETFAEISATRGGRLMSDPSLLVTRPAVSAPSRIIHDADGTSWEPVSVLAPCPNLESASLDWENLQDPYVAEVLGELSRRGWHGINREFMVARIDTPATWQEQGMGAGSPFGLAHLFRQTGPFRPRNFSGRLPRNLVLAGSTTVPGVGVPTVMISGRLAAQRFGPPPADGV